MHEETRIKKVEALAKRTRQDMIAGTLSALFALGYFAETFNFRVVKAANTIDATFMPRMLACLVFACSAALFLQGWSGYRRIPLAGRAVPAEEKREARVGELRCLAAVVVLVVAASLFKKLGFILTMPWMMFLLFVILEKKEKRRYGLCLLLSCVSPVLLFLLFYYGFSQLLPMGILKPFLSRFL